MCSLFASERAFSAFFALASADLVDFSALTLAAVAASKAFLEASSSASSDEMQALAVAKASANQTGKRKSNKTAKKSSEDKQSIGKRITLGSHSSFQILDTFSAQSDKFLHQILSRKIHVSTKIKQETKENIPVSTLTSSEELVDWWASREAPTSVDFFKRLEPRVTAGFLTGALEAFGAFAGFTTGSTSCTEGLSAALVSTEGVVVASLFGSSLSLQRKARAFA
jgi:hypothetical protein